MFLIESWERWSILSGRHARAVGGVRVVLKAEVGVFGVEQRCIEAAVHPAASFAVQGGGKQMPDDDETCILEAMCRRWSAEMPALPYWPGHGRRR